MVNQIAPTLDRLVHITIGGDLAIENTTPEPAPPPAPIAEFEGTPTIGEVPLTVLFTDLTMGGIPTAWAWTFGDGGTSSLEDPSYTYASAGSYEVTMTVTVDTNNYVVPKPAYITVTAPPPPPGPLDAYSANMMFCYGRRTLLSSYATQRLYRVRRSTDNVESDIIPGTDGTDTTNLTAFVGSASAYLVTWYDQSGMGLDMTQPTAGAQPLVVNAGTILRNFQPNGTTDGMATTGSVAASAGMSFYFTGVPYPATGTGLPLMFGTNASPKTAIMAYAILGGGNSGLLVGIGSANGNSYTGGDADDAYAVVFDTTKSTFITQVNIYVDGGNPTFHGTAGSVDNNPISGGQICYASSVNFSSNYSEAQFRTFVGYSVAHSMATATAINLICNGT